VGGLLVSGSVVAAGFGLQNQNGAGTGYAYAGAAAMAEDASTIYFNPAGMTHLSAHHHVSGALSVLVRSLRFSDTGSNPLMGIYPLGNSGGQGGGVAAIPAAYWTMPVTSRLRIGLGLSPTFGNATKWNDSFIGRYQGTFSDITAINFNPSLAWQVNGALSLGLGLNVVRFDADLRTMSPATALLPVRADIETRMTGSDIGFGYNLGAMIQLTPATRIGATYRSAVDLKVEGHLKAPGSDIPTFVSVELPATASLALSHWISERWQLLGDLTWTGWNGIQALTAGSRTSGTILVNERLAFRNSIRAGLGAQYRFSEAVRLRTGVAYDRSPVRNREDRTVRLPDADRIWLAFGFNCRLTEHTSIDTGYAYVFIGSASIDRATADDPLLQKVHGRFDSSAHIFSVQLNHRF
jgi:long-chain fatty acid transport protein